MAIRPAPDEQGFVLIGAIWLLILAGAIVSVVMLRNITHAQQASHDADNLRNRLALEGAVETVFAERLIDSNRSQWWLIPVAGTVRIGDIDVSIALSSEGTRFDLNEVALPLLDDLVRRYGVDAQDREYFAQTLRNLRLSKRKLRSSGEVDALLHRLPARVQACLTERLTILSGLAKPNRHEEASMHDLRGISETMAGKHSTTLIGQPDTANALRVTARTPLGQSLIAIGRITASMKNPLSVPEWRFGSLSEVCPRVN